MKSRRAARYLSLILMGIVSILVFTSCDNAPPKTSDAKPANQSQPIVAGKDGSRIDALIKAWNDAGVKAQIKEKTSSSTLNSMYGCINQYTVVLDEQQFAVLEYDLNNLNSTAQSYLQFIDKNGYDAKTNDPAWHKEEFLLRNSYSVMESGKAVAKFSVKDHPKSEQILAAFQAFK
ncbi:MAG: hypothetical protein ACOX87_12860 [Chloroflexota bacterium]|jgi:hypothetical protein